MTSLTDIQRHVGVIPDGRWGPNTAAAIARALGMATATRAGLTVKVLGEIVSHEAIVLEAYKDSVGVWTWGVGVTNASGHSVDRYKDNPQTVRKCLEVYFWLLRERYLPAVMEAFDGRALNEAQLAAALSFHYNTGSINRASWVKSWVAGQPTVARKQFMEWRKPAEIVKRRQAECDLFFDGRWAGDGRATVYQVAKPRYTPSWASAKRIDITADLAAIAGAANE